LTYLLLPLNFPTRLINGYQFLSCDKISNILPLIFVFVEAHASCDYFSRKLVSFDNRYDFLVGDVQFISMFSYQQASDAACIHYATDNTYFDPRFKASRALSVFTIVAGGLLLVILWLAACTKISLPVWYITASFLFINSTAEGLVLLLKSSAICDETFGICR
jgi:hypothetical protein